MGYKLVRENVGYILQSPMLLMIQSD